MGRSKYIFFQRRYTGSQLVYEKIFYIINHQGNAIKTTIRHHLIPGGMAIARETGNNSCR